MTFCRSDQCWLFNHNPFHFIIAFHQKYASIENHYSMVLDCSTTIVQKNLIIHSHLTNSKKKNGNNFDSAQSNQWNGKTWQLNWLIIAFTGHNLVVRNNATNSWKKGVNVSTTTFFPFTINQTHRQTNITSKQANKQTSTAVFSFSFHANDLPEKKTFLIMQDFGAIYRTQQRQRK